MRSVARRPGRWKKKVSEHREGVKMMQAMVGTNDIDVKVSLIQELIPIGALLQNANFENPRVKNLTKSRIHFCKNCKMGYFATAP